MPYMDLRTSCTQVFMWFADSIPATALLGFLRALWFPPTKLEYLHISGPELMVVSSCVYKTVWLP